MTDALTSDARDEADARDAADAADASLLSPTFVFRDINHILSTGQSLSVGSQGNTILSTSQPYANVTLTNGPRYNAAGLGSFTPLVELGVETMSSGLANLITKMAREQVLVGQPAAKSSHDLLVSVHGIGGTPYTGLKKGGTTAAYANGMAQLQAGFDLAKAANKSYVVRALTNVHGESDHRNGNIAYEADLVEWQADYEADVKAVTGQADPVPMFHTQFSSWTRYMTTTSDVAMAQLAAHVNNPGKIILVGAKYHLQHVADGVHLESESYQHMGEDYAKAYRRVILEGKPWEPVRPKTVTRSGAVITAKMHAPAPPLVLDTTLVTNPGNFGFEYTDDEDPTTAPKITSVALSGSDTVVITLSKTPTAANKRLRYAFTAPVGALGGPTTGARGNLRDSDDTPSRNGYKLYNWAVHFDVASP